MKSLALILALSASSVLVPAARAEDSKPCPGSYAEKLGAEVEAARKAAKGPVGMVQWNSLLTGASGQGKPMALANALAWAQSAQRENPELHHWVVIFDEADEKGQATITWATGKAEGHGTPIRAGAAKGMVRKLNQKYGCGTHLVLPVAPNGDFEPAPK